MAGFWRKNKPLPSDSPYWRSRAAHPAFRGPLLSESDWAQIDDLLTGARRSQNPVFDHRIAELVISLDRFQGSVKAPFVGAIDLIDPLLDIWSIASKVGRQAARPIERLLSAIVGRDLATAYEINSACDETRVAACRMRPPTGHMV